ncbi:MAG: HAMP domain-containing sensor histidine kinase [Acidimicrobiia bacterium]|nr:HAMP domain-containing sensor histidine kinase [Acidimicrobiia bacterium]
MIRTRPEQNEATAVAAPARTTVATAPVPTRRISWWAVATATLVVTLAASALVFSIAHGTRTAAEQGTVGILEEAVISAAASTHNRTVVAELMAEAAAVGLTSSDAAARARDAAEAAAAVLVARSADLVAGLSDPSLADRIEADVAVLVDSTREVLNLIDQGDLETASTTVTGAVEESYTELVEFLAAERGEILSQILVAGEEAGRLTDAARFLVVLLVPLSVLLSYRAYTRRQQRRRKLEYQLEKEQAVNKTKDEFIANLSHELRTPLTCIYGISLEMVETPVRTDPVLAAELANLIAIESGELTRMVEDLLTAATEDQGGLVVKIEDVDVESEAEAVTAPLIATGSAIEVTVEPAVISCDRLRLRQIIRNLVSNAQNHGGPTNRIVGRREGGRYVIEVRDDGPGVPPELEERLFTRFIHQGDTPLLTGSVGLGLSIVQVLATHTGGTIAYRRDNGETVFALTFPLAGA